MGSFAPTIRSNNPTEQSADISVPSAPGLSGRAYASNVMCAKIDLASLSITVTDTGGANGGYGSQKISDHPEGVIKFIGASAKITSITAAAGISASGTVKFSVGTVAASTNDTLSTTKANIIPSTSITLSSSAGTGFGSSADHGAWIAMDIDGHTTAADVYLNIGVADASISSSSSVTLTGTIYVWYINLGD